MKLTEEQWDHVVDAFTGHLEGTGQTGEGRVELLRNYAHPSGRDCIAAIGPLGTEVTFLACVAQALIETGLSPHEPMPADLLVAEVIALSRQLAVEIEVGDRAIWCLPRVSVEVAASRGGVL